MPFRTRTYSHSFRSASERRVRRRLESRRPADGAFSRARDSHRLLLTVDNLYFSQATASGDQTVKLWDVESQTCVGVLSGHTCTIKNVVWDPRNPSETSLTLFSVHALWLMLLTPSGLLSTASRDGSIRVWDRRARNADSNSVSTVNMIKNAHGTKGKVSKGVRRAQISGVPRSTRADLDLVPSVALRHQERHGSDLPSSIRQPSRFFWFGRQCHQGVGLAKVSQSSGEPRSCRDERRSREQHCLGTTTWYLFVGSRS